MQKLAIWHCLQHTRTEKNKNKNEVNWTEGINSLTVKICCTQFSKSDPLIQMYFLPLSAWAFLLQSYFFNEHSTGHVSTTTIPLHRPFLPPWIISRKLSVHLSAVERIWALESEQMDSDWERQLKESKNMVPQAVVRKPGCSHTARQPRAPSLALCTLTPKSESPELPLWLLCSFVKVAPRAALTVLFSNQSHPQMHSPVLAQMQRPSCVPFPLCPIYPTNCLAQSPAPST